MKRSILYVLLLLLTTACSPANSPEEKASPEPRTAAGKAPEKSKEEGQMHREYYEDGSLQLEGRLVNGERHGMWTSYYQNGLKWSETTFRNGIKDGTTRSYYESGIMRYSGQYYNDYKTGIWQFYNEEGYLEKNEDLTPKLQDKKEK
ncbi:MAG: hypothetical protein EA392_02155 [Cryomorphaceae bacterium]|nr:MAG: hypothetical protein EA392_02155 [Cryomorphaceae bacterium]